MIRLMPVLILCLSWVLPVRAAQLYRWVDDKGRVEWRDTTPPTSAKKVEKRAVNGSVIETSTLPYGTQLAIRNFPVTLYVTACGEGCDKAKTHLQKRGVPYTLRNPQDDMDAFKKLTGGGLEIPFLLIGSQQLKGYEQGAWDSALDTAGYPRAAAVPATVTTPPPPPKPAAKPAAAPPPGAVPGK
jgi:hypothetical protein